MKTIPLLLLLLTISHAVYAYEWFTAPTVRELIAEGVFILLVYIDYHQTLDFLEAGKEEMNPSLRRHPSKRELQEDILAGLLLHGFGLWAAPKELKGYYLTTSISIEGYVVWLNYRTEAMYGISIRYEF